MRVPSNQHWKVEPGTSEVKAKVADVAEVTWSGPEVMVAVGGTSTVHS